MQASAYRGYGAVVMMNSSLAGDPTKCEGECALMEEIMGSLARGPLQLPGLADPRLHCRCFGKREPRVDGNRRDPEVV